MNPDLILVAGDVICADIRECKPKSGNCRCDLYGNGQLCFSMFSVQAGYLTAVCVNQYAAWSVALCDTYR